MINNPSPKRNIHLLGKGRFKARYLLLILMGFVVLCVSRPYHPPAVVSVEPAELEAPAESAVLIQEIVPAPPEVTVEKVKIRRGDTLYDILRAKGLSDPRILAVSNGKIDGISPSRLVVGRSYRLYVQDGQVTEYQYEPDDKRILRIAFDVDPPVLSVEPIPYEVFTAPVSGVIKDSLFAAVEAINEKPSLAMDLADLFAWQVDFFRDLRAGDTFTALVDKYYRDGKFAHYGQIQAARFVNNGKTHSGFLFTPQGGRADYFDESGGSLRKQFLKSPLRFRRISSGFSRKRLHPVTGKVTAHLGIDYAAPTGTPIVSIGDGKVLFKKHDSINGRIVKIRHNGTYSSAYAHMNSFAKGVGKGSRIRQGQIIGYVGRSGRATGPHLHFAMYRNGSYVDPRRISVPRATSIPDRDRSAFDHKRKEIALLLDGEPGEQITENGVRADVLR
jgi:murein DD-endopeptidase MepM/ murein hydrolase activator NlpD